MPSGLNTATEVAKATQVHIYLVLFITFAAMHIYIYKIHLVHTQRPCEKQLSLQLTYLQPHVKLNYPSNKMF